MTLSCDLGAAAARRLSEADAAGATVDEVTIVVVIEADADATSPLAIELRADYSSDESTSRYPSWAPVAASYAVVGTLALEAIVDVLYAAALPGRAPPARSAEGIVGGAAFALLDQLQYVALLSQLTAPGFLSLHRAAAAASNIWGTRAFLSQQARRRREARSIVLRIVTNRLSCSAQRSCVLVGAYEQALFAQRAWEGYYVQRAGQALPLESTVNLGTVVKQ